MAERSIAVVGGRLRHLQVDSTTIVFASILTLKFVLLVLWGPVLTPDSAGYVAVADAISESRAWLYHVDLSSEAVPMLGLRMIGYPILIAVLRTLSGPAWPYLLVILQFTISMVACALLLSLGRELGLRREWALAAVVATATSLQLTVDQAILTDSLHANFVIMAVCVIARGGAALRPFRGLQAATAGILIVLAFLIREAMQFLILAFLPLLFVRILCAQRSITLRSVAAGILVLMPLMMAGEAYKRWNVVRTGERFVTTSPQTAIPLALATAAKFDASVLDGNDIFQTTSRAVFRHHIFREVIDLNYELFKVGYKATEIARMSFAHYRDAWMRQPLAMLRIASVHASETQFKLAVRPIGAICEMALWRQKECPGYRELLRELKATPAALDVTGLLLIVGITIERIVSICVFLAFLLGVPCWFLLSSRSSTRPLNAVVMLNLSLWILYLCWFSAYAIVHVEPRYLTPVIPFSVIGGLLVWRRGLVLWSVRRAALGLR